MQIIKINDIVVITEENSPSIVDGVLVFQDGSNINPIKNVRSNYGMAKAAITWPFVPFEEENAPELAENRKPKRFSKKFQGKRLSITANSLMAIKVVPHEGIETIVSVVGPAEDVDALTIHQVGEVIEIIGKHISSAYTSISSLELGSSTSIHMSSYVLSGDIADEDLIKVEVKVPVGQPLELDGKWYSADIGNILAPLQLTQEGIRLVTVGQVKATSIKMGSIGEVRIEQVSEKLIVKANGVGSLKVRELKVSELDIVHSGTGKISIGEGFAKTAELYAQSVGDINLPITFGTLKAVLKSTGSLFVGVVSGNGPCELVAQSTGSIKVETVDVPNLVLSTTGVGSIKIRGGQVQKLDVLANGVGSISFDGTAKDAEIKSFGLGNVAVERVTGQVSKTQRGLGKIKVKHQS